MMDDIDSNATNFILPEAPTLSVDDLDSRNQTTRVILDNSAGTAYPYQNQPGCQGGYELVLVALTLPLWTFVLIYLILLLIQYLRSTQTCTIYDKCNWRNAHFRYDFHLMIGKHSSNYNRAESFAVLDLLDNQLVSTMTVQIPGTTMFNEQQVFVYRHSRNDLRCVSFTVYRRHPIKDVKSIRIAHTCNNTDSRIYIYGLQIHDETNAENRFFPIQSAVKYRGTQWALVTSFEPRPDMSFKKLGLDCYDPFGLSYWPTYLETLTLLVYIWCSNYCFGHVIEVREIFNSQVVHALTIFFITATSAGILAITYLRIFKIHVLDNHYVSCWWLVGQYAFNALLILVSIGLWILALGESKRCYTQTVQWFISTVTSSVVVTLIVVLVWWIAGCRRRALDRKLLAETDAQMLKTNSRTDMTFVNDPKPGLCASLFMRQRNPDSHSSGREVPPKNLTGPGPHSDSSKALKAIPGSRKSKSQDPQQQKQKQELPTAAKDRDVDETLDTAFGVGSKYIKAKNRNSISQYV